MDCNLDILDMKLFFKICNLDLLAKWMQHACTVSAGFARVMLTAGYGSATLS
jgi:hypothetical protein